MSADTILVTVSETGESPYAVNIGVGAHALKGDEPASMGGADLGPAPFDLLTAALAECTCMTVRWYAREHGWPVEHVAVEVTHRKDKVEGSPALRDIFEKSITIKGDALTAEQRAQLLKVAGKCPVQRTLEGAPLIATKQITS